MSHVDSTAHITSQPQRACLYQRLAVQAARTPEAIALAPLGASHAPTDGYGCM